MGSGLGKNPIHLGIAHPSRGTGHNIQSSQFGASHSEGGRGGNGQKFGSRRSNVLQKSTSQFRGRGRFQRGRGRFNAVQSSPGVNAVQNAPQVQNQAMNCPKCSNELQRWKEKRPMLQLQRVWSFLLGMSFCTTIIAKWWKTESWSLEYQRTSRRPSRRTQRWSWRTTASWSRSGHVGTRCTCAGYDAECRCTHSAWP